MNENVSKPEISVVILCYRAEDFAPIFVKEVQATLERNSLNNYELVLVANYQPALKGIDRTPDIVRELASADPRLVVVAKEKKGMMGWDMRSGLYAATGETIAVIDGDGQMPPGDIIKVYTLLKQGNFDVVKTYRNQRFDGVKRKMISIVYNLLLKILFPKVKVRDANSKPKIFTRAALNKLQLTADDWFIDAEIVIKASEFGMKIGEAPTTFYPNQNRPSFVRATAIFEFIKNLFMYRWKSWFTKNP